MSNEELQKNYDELLAFNEDEIVKARRCYFGMYKVAHGKAPHVKVLSELGLAELHARGAELLAEVGIEVEAPTVAKSNIKLVDEPAEEEVTETPVEEVKEKAKSAAKNKTKPAAAAKVDNQVPANVDVPAIAQAVAAAIGKEFEIVRKEVATLGKSVKDLAESIDELSKQRAEDLPDEMREMSAKMDTFRQSLSDALSSAAMELMGE